MRALAGKEYGIEQMKKWKKTGALLQLDASSLFSNGIIRKQAMLLLKNNLIDFVSSDTHKNSETIDYFGKAFRYIERKLDKEFATRLFITNPRKLLNY